MANLVQSSGNNPSADPRETVVVDLDDRSIVKNMSEILRAFAEGAEVVPVFGRNRPIVRDQIAGKLFRLKITIEDHDYEHPLRGRWLTAYRAGVTHLEYQYNTVFDYLPML